METALGHLKHQNLFLLQEQKDYAGETQLTVLHLREFSACAGRQYEF
jgi:hypothetical protein